MKDSRLFSAIIILFTSILLSLGIAILNYIAGNSSIISYILSSIPVIISLFYLGASIHLTTIENKINKEELEQYGEIITERMSYINILINRGKEALKNFQARSSSEVLFHTDTVHSNVLMLRRFINALEERQDKLVELSRTANLKEAEELSFSQLTFINSSLYSVDKIDMPSLAHDQWEDRVNALVKYLEVKKAAA